MKYNHVFKKEKKINIYLITIWDGFNLMMLYKTNKKLFKVKIKMC